MTAVISMLTAGSFAEISGCSLSGNPEAPILRARADSRLCRPGDLYVALKGERVDGNDFVASAWDAGADVVLADTGAELPVQPNGKALLLSDNPLASLQKAAGVLRRGMSKLRVVGITGSNGKTTTKEILASIARSAFGGRALVSEGNYNSDIGLPLTLCGLRPDHDVAILEMGMNRPGEMAVLADIARPDIALITNIGTAHVGMLGSREALAAEKRSVFSHADRNSVAIVAESEKWADFLLDAFPGEAKRFGTWGLDGWEGFEDLGLDGFRLVRYGRTLSFSLPGRHNLCNAMAAVEAALALGIAEDDIVAGLEAVVPASGRSEVRKGSITVIRDAYNANPESLSAALRLVANTTVEGKRVLVLGELLELGDETEEALKVAGETVAEIGADAVFLFGSGLSVLKKAAVEAGFTGKVELFDGIEELKSSLAAYLRPGDLVLLKGSRGSALERLDEILSEVGLE